MQTEHLSLLAARIRWGDPWAAEDLRQELVPQMIYLVRRAMRSGTGVSRLDRQIHAEASKLRARQSDVFPADQEALVKRVARNLCESLIGRLRAGTRTGRALSIKDTVLN